MNDFLWLIKEIDKIIISSINKDNDYYYKNEVNIKNKEQKQEQNVKTLVWHTEDFPKTKNKTKFQWITK